jgi:peroxiredoxin
MTLLLAIALAVAITPKERFEALVKQHEAHPGAFASDLEVENAVCRPFVEIAEQSPSDPAAFEALNWVVIHVAFVKAADPAMDILARDYSASERLLPIIQRLDQFTDTTPSMIRLLGAALRDTPDRSTRAWACLVLGRSLAKRKNLFETLYARLALTLHANPDMRRVLVHSLDEENEAAFLDAMGKEAEQRFEQVVGQFADFKDLAHTARRELFELRHLSIGCTTPEIEGRDIDGKPFKLSDYRGKVVVLDFWTQRCGPCVGAFPKFRQYVKQFEGKPFVLLGVNCGDEASDLLALRQKGEITWRFWCDGPVEDGPIFEAWNIWNFPTIYVIDPQGVIRYKNLNVGLIPTAVDILSEKGELKPLE